MMVSLMLMAPLSTACDFSDQDVSKTPPYSDFVGRRYRVLVDDLHGYGIGDKGGSTATWITLIPAPGIGGRDVVFERPVPKGRTFRIVGAARRFLLFDKGVYYRVMLDDEDWPAVTTKIELFRGNEGEGASLNPRVYRLLQGNEEP
jgi:hypothetical protein